MTRLREEITIEVEVSDEQIGAALAQAAKIDQTAVAQAMMPLLVRQVFFELPQHSNVALQLPNFVVQKTEKLLEDKSGQA